MPLTVGLPCTIVDWRINWIGKEEEKNGMVTVKDTLPEFSWRDWGKSRRPSVRVVGVPTSILTRRSLHTRPQQIHHMVWPAPFRVTLSLPLVSWVVFHVDGEESYLTLTTWDLRASLSSQCGSVATSCCIGQIISYLGCSAKGSVILVVFCIACLGILQNLIQAVRARGIQKYMLMF